jgi:hypothetical protein
MNEGRQSFPVVREAVASFPDREHLQHAIDELVAAGFDRSALSVLASHESLTAVGAGSRLLPEGVADEITYIGPLTIAGIIVLSAGPIGAAVAALVGVGIGGAALKQFFDRYTAAHHSAGYEAALRDGAVLLWCRCEDPERELRATRILEEAGGRHIHVHGRPADKRG